MSAKSKLPEKTPPQTPPPGDAPAHHIHIGFFDPDALSETARARLESLLDKADELTAARGAFLLEGKIKALFHWLAKPDDYTPRSHRAPFYDTIPDDRFTAELEDFKAAHSDKSEVVNLVSKLQTYPVERQKIGWACMQDTYHNHIDHERLRDYNRDLGRLYDTILKDYPNILNDAADFEGSIRMGRALADDYKSFGKAWRRATAPERIEMARQSLKAAFNDASLDHVHFGTFSHFAVAGVYSGSLTTDTLAVTKDYLNSHRPGRCLSVFMHEYQHRRQQQLVAELDRGGLEKGSAAYYRARLFRANFENGYLSSVGNKTVNIEQYRAQPVERDAQTHERVVGKMTFGKFALTWTVPAAQGRKYQAMVRPQDIVQYHGPGHVPPPANDSARYNEPGAAANADKPLDANGNTFKGTYPSHISPEK